jgi:vitamin B12 transporter
MRKIFKMAMALFVLISFLALPVIGLTEEYTTGEEVKKEGAKKEEKTRKEKEEKKAVELEEIVVTATRTPEMTRDVPVHVEGINREEIEESGAMTVGDIIGKKVTGHFHRYQGLLQPVGLRGFRTETHGDDIKGHVLILMDGHRIGTGNLAKILPDMVERIEIIKGPASALYGAAAMGGVVNIITKKGVEEIKTTLKQELGSFGYQKTSLSSGGGVNDWFGYQIAASYEDFDNLKTKNYGEIYNSNERHKFIGGNLFFYPCEDQEIRLGFDYVDLIGHNSGWAATGRHTTYDTETKSYADKSRGHMDIEYNRPLMEDKLHWKAMVYHLWDHNEWYSGDPTVEAVEDDATMYEDKTWGTDQQLTLQLIPHNKVVVGGAYEKLTKEAEGRKDGAPKRTYTPGMEYKTTSLYAQDAIDLLDERLILIFGARYDRFDLTTKRPETGEYLSFIEQAKDFDDISPRGGFVYKFNDLFRIRGNIGQAFKSPSAHKLSARYEYTSWGKTRRTLGNPDLKPEICTTYEFGFDFNHEVVSFGVTGFHTDHKDMVVRAKDKVVYDGKEWDTYENLGKAEIQGIELYTTWDIGCTFELPFGLDLSSNIVFNTKYKDEINKEDLKYISDYEVKSGLRFNYQKATVRLSHVWIGPQMIINYDTSPATVDEKKAFNFFDLTLRYKLPKSCNLEVGVYNLFDDDYEWVGGYPMPERNFKAGFSYTF